jgi:hypothetical protein
MIMVQALLMAGVGAAQIRSYPLDERCVYTVRLSTDEPTTCVFPGALTALEGAKLSAKAEDGAEVLISHPAGAEFFSLRAVKSGAKAALNVVYRGKVYSLKFVAEGEPDRAVVFLDQALAGGRRLTKDEEELRGLLARAKQLDRVAEQYPEMELKCERKAVAQTTHYRSFDATIEEVVRFDAEDVLVFQVRIENRAEQVLRYDAEALAVRVRHEIFPAALVDAGGEVAPKAEAQIYLVVSGDGSGGRANLSVRENFTVMIPPA